MSCKILGIRLKMVDHNTYSSKKYLLGMIELKREAAAVLTQMRSHALYHYKLQICGN